MGIELVLSIVGTFLVLGLAINAFFLKGIFKDLNDVKIQLAEINGLSVGRELRLSKTEESIKDLYSMIGANNQKIHKVEGANASALSLIKMIEKDIERLKQ